MYTRIFFLFFHNYSLKSIQKEFSCSVLQDPCLTTIGYNWSDNLRTTMYTFWFEDIRLREICFTARWSFALHFSTLPSFLWQFHAQICEFPYKCLYCRKYNAYNYSIQTKCGTSGLIHTFVLITLTENPTSLALVASSSYASLPLELFSTLC